MSVIFEHPYVIADPQHMDNEPIIRDTKTTVRAIVELWRLGILPEEIPQHLPHLNLAQIFDALSYYSDHQDQVNHYIEINRVPDHLVHPAARP